MTRRVKTSRAAFTLVELSFDPASLKLRRAGKLRTARRPAVSRRGAGAFTLIELMIVISAITLILSITLPSIVGMFGAGADAQAVNIVTAQLMAARSKAVCDATYAGVHVQLGNPDHGLGGQCWLAVVEIVERQPNLVFGKSEGYAPIRLPGDIALGELSTRSVSGSGYNQTGVANEDDFTTFTIVFSPSGKLVTQVEGQDIAFKTTDVLFSSDPNLGVWKLDVANRNTNGGSAGEPGATALTLFEYGKYVSRSDAAAKRDYLEEAGQFLPVNVHTGQLFPRK